MKEREGGRNNEVQNKCFSAARREKEKKPIAQIQKNKWDHWATLYRSQLIERWDVLFRAFSLFLLEYLLPNDCFVLLIDHWLFHLACYLHCVHVHISVLAHSRGGQRLLSAEKERETTCTGTLHCSYTAKCHKGDASTSLRPRVLVWHTASCAESMPCSTFKEHTFTAAPAVSPAVSPRSTTGPSPPPPHVYFPFPTLFKSQIRVSAQEAKVEEEVSIHLIP